MLYFEFAFIWGMQSHQVSDFIVLDVDYDSDPWFGPLDLSNKSLMENFALWMSILGIQAHTHNVQAKQQVRLAYN